MVTEGSSFYNAEWQSKASKKRKDDSNSAEGSAPKAPKNQNDKTKTKPAAAKVDPKAVVDSDEDSVSDKDK